MIDEDTKSKLIVSEIIQEWEESGLYINWEIMKDFNEIRKDWQILYSKHSSFI